MDIGEFLGTGIRALGIGGGYAIMALGFNVVFAASGVFNFGQGELYIYGGFLGFLLLTTLGLPYPAAVPVVRTAPARGRPAVRRGKTVRSTCRC